jgi:hypothetical protein
MNGTWDKEGDPAQIGLSHPLGLTKMASQTFPGAVLPQLALPITPSGLQLPLLGICTDWQSNDPLIGSEISGKLIYGEVFGCYDGVLVAMPGKGEHGIVFSAKTVPQD